MASLARIKACSTWRMARVWLGPAGVALWILRASIRAQLRSELLRRFCSGVGVWCANMLSKAGFALSPTNNAPLSLPSRMATVSYTHLRAHETRHDLVCRL